MLARWIRVQLVSFVFQWRTTGILMPDYGRRLPRRGSFFFSFFRNPCNVSPVMAPLARSLLMLFLASAPHRTCSSTFMFENHTIRAPSSRDNKHCVSKFYRNSFRLTNIRGSLLFLSLSNRLVEIIALWPWSYRCTFVATIFFFPFFFFFKFVTTD